jgi:DtxR family transcriptional regulator, Mn-dependent transcriptional regulator
MDHHDLSASIQDYAKEIYELETSEGQVRTSMLAERLGVSAPSVSGMIRTLVDRGLVAHESYRGVTLTPEGERVALGVIRHHRLLELFLAESLGVPWGRVHEEAELLEHAISEELEEQIAARLGDPSRNPYGEPIPSREGAIKEVGGSSLTDLEAGQTGIFAEIPHAEPGVLSLLDKRGIRIGDRIELIEKTGPGSYFVRVSDREHVLDQATASAMRLVVAEEQ